MIEMLWAGAGAGGAALAMLWWAVAPPRRGSARAARNLTTGLGARIDQAKSQVAPRPGFGQRLASTAPTGLVRSLERRILLAGAPEQWPVERVLVVKVVLGLAGVGLGMLRIFGGGSKGPLLLLVGSIAGFFGPDLLLTNIYQKRQQEIQRTLPDTIDQVTISVEAGLGFDGAVAKVARSGQGPLAQELLRVLQDMQTGMSRGEAMRGLLGRTNVEEIRRFVAAVLQADKFGVPMVKVLRAQADDLRIKRRQRAEEQAMKLPVKVMIPVVMCILPALFVVVMGPAAINMVHNFRGHM